MAAYSEQRFTIRGIETVVQIAGDGDPLVYFHGAGTVTGFDALLPLAERFRLIVPFHPGFGPSADDPTVDDIHDYRRHYLDLLDELGVGEFALAGSSMGGWLAANFAVDHAERVKRLVLAAPLGLKVDDHPTTDIFAIPGDQVFSYLPPTCRCSTGTSRCRRPQSSSPIATARRRRPRGCCGRAPTTSSCTAGCTA